MSPVPDDGTSRRRYDSELTAGQVEIQVLDGRDSEVTGPTDSTTVPRVCT